MASAHVRFYRVTKRVAGHEDHSRCAAAHHGLPANTTAPIASDYGAKSFLGSKCGRTHLGIACSLAGPTRSRRQPTRPGRSCSRVQSRGRVARLLLLLLLVVVVVLLLLLVVLLVMVLLLLLVVVVVVVFVCP